MSGQYLTDPLAFLINTLFGLYILAIMLRFLLQWVRADYSNPISQFLIRITQPPLQPLRRVLPPIGRADTSALVLMLLLQFCTLALVYWINGTNVSAGFLFVRSAAELLNLLLNVFLVVIIIRVILSWVNPGHYNPAIGIIDSLANPVMEPVRRIIPAIGGLDLSPIAALIGIQLAKMLFVMPLRDLAMAFL
ncbi:YggT family protein [Aquisalimonas sp.]|uniref:YggT family protein n=1 Tax=unclassified Aquisalimonas TaxID=2644645 RepID=UPI0025BF6326|nr:YggT family protein [Aquisalimonas sp.]